jgi:hypothetical protein
MCCGKKNVKLPRIRNARDELVQYPLFLENLLTNPSNWYHKRFGENIRCYNNALSFASMGAYIFEVSNSNP